MREIVGGIFQSLDGVIQAPGGPTEDWTGGFRHGGWMFPLADEAVGAAIGGILSGGYDLLLGRRTYEIFAAYWPYYDAGDEDGGIATQFNRANKYVLTRNVGQPLDWENSHRIADIDAVAALKASAGPPLVIQGSSTLYPALIEAGLLDRLTILTFPLVLGHGRRLFGDGSPARTMTLTDHLISPNGTIIATYVPAGAVETGSFGTVPPNLREDARQARMQTEG